MLWSPATGCDPLGTCTCQTGWLSLMRPLLRAGWSHKSISWRNRQWLLETDVAAGRGGSSQSAWHCWSSAGHTSQAPATLTSCQFPEQPKPLPCLRTLMLTASFPRTHWLSPKSQLKHFSSEKSSLVIPSILSPYPVPPQCSSHCHSTRFYFLC